MNYNRKRDFKSMSTVMKMNTETAGGETVRNPAVSVFVCSNCARPGRKPVSASRPGPVLPDFHWPFPVERIVVPCAGRIQPEHILKTFESGADIVLIVACGKDNCHYIEGSARCAHRVDFTRSILKEIGLGNERLMFVRFPGSAREDMSIDAGHASPVRESDSRDSEIASIREQTVRALETLPGNPLRFC